MKKDKITLTDLKIQSIVTSLGDRQMKEIKGGTTAVRGRRHSYSTRWTSVDTRIEPVHDGGPLVPVTPLQKI